MNVHQSACPKTVPERPAVSELFGAAIEEITGILTVRPHVQMNEGKVSRRGHTGAVDEDVQRAEGDPDAVAPTLALCSMGAR